jgi:hypothetical protein
VYVLTESSHDGIEDIIGVYSTQAQAEAMRDSLMSKYFFFTDIVECALDVLPESYERFRRVQIHVLRDLHLNEKTMPPRSPGELPHLMGKRYTAGADMEVPAMEAELLDALFPGAIKVSET